MTHSKDYEKEFEIYGDKIGKVGYVDHMGSDLKAVNAARNSYGGHSGKLVPQDKKLLKHLMDEKHYGVLEHNVVTFRFVVPIFVARQFHRHRTWSYNEISRRYTSTKIDFFVPFEIRKQDLYDKQSSIPFDSSEIEKIKNIKNKIMKFNDQAYQNYLELMDDGLCRELARGSLPHNLYTSFWGTANLRNILLFLDLRLSGHAQKEIRLVAEAMEKICSDLYPNIMILFKKGLLCLEEAEEEKEARNT